MVFFFLLLRFSVKAGREHIFIYGSINMNDTLILTCFLRRPQFLVDSEEVMPMTA